MPCTTSPDLSTSVAHHAAPLLEWSTVHRLYDLPLKLKGKTHLSDGASSVGIVLVKQTSLKN
jgi:hypothetical protein